MKVKELIDNFKITKNARRDLKIAAAVKRAIQWNFGACIEIRGDKERPDLCEIYINGKLAENAFATRDELDIWLLVGLTNAKTFKIAEMKRELYGLEMFLWGKFGVRKQFNALRLALA